MFVFSFGLLLAIPLTCGLARDCRLYAAGLTEISSSSDSHALANLEQFPSGRHELPIFASYDAYGNVWSGSFDAMPRSTTSTSSCTTSTALCTYDATAMFTHPYSIQAAPFASMTPSMASMLQPQQAPQTMPTEVHPLHAWAPPPTMLVPHTSPAPPMPWPYHHHPRRTPHNTASHQ